MANYATGHAINTHELFTTFDVSKLKMDNELCTKLFSDGNKRDFSCKIFARALEIVIDDIIDNNVHFKFPGFRNTGGYMYMQRTEGKKFKRAFKNGKWNDVDFLESNFSGYQLAIDVYKRLKSLIHKSIYLSAEDRNRITEHTNNGKQY